MGDEREEPVEHSEPPLGEWADRLEATCAACSRLGLRNVRVLAETASTQDAAWQASAGHAGWLVVAGRQTAGRGRLGRAWADTRGLGLALTLTLPVGALSSLGVGLAVCRAAAPHLPDCAPGLRWPNDVVERGAPGRKLAGVLVETRSGVALIGIGVNVRQEARDWPDALRGRAVSLYELGARPSRLHIACAIVTQLEAVAALTDAQTAHEASMLDTLTGTRRCFHHDGRRFEGLVESIEPTGAIRLRLADGSAIDLPAQTTSLIHA